MESKSTKQLIEAANRKCEMRWKVLAFNPDEDNKLVKEFKDFDCIDCAVAKKREYLEKNPTHVVEVISESRAQRNEDKEFTIKLVTPFGKAKVCSWRAASVNDAVKEFLDANPAYRENKKGAVIAESCEQKNEALYKIAKTNKEKEEILAKIEKDPSLKLVSIDKVVSGWKDNKNGIPIAQYNTRITYKKESAQKNEEVTKSNYKSIINELESIFKKFAGNGLELGHKIKPNSFDLPFDTSLSVALKDKVKLEPVKAALKKVIDKYGAKKVAHDNDFAYNFGKSNRDGIYVGFNWNATSAFVGYAVNPDFDVKALSESAQKNEASSLQDLNKELANNVETLYFVAKHVRDRFKYRTLQNMSYDVAQAEKIYDQLKMLLKMQLRS